MLSNRKINDGNVSAKESLILIRVMKPASINIDRPIVERREIFNSVKYPIINPALPNNWAIPVIIL